MARPNKMLVLVAGDPVPAVLAERGGYPEIIAGAGGFASVAAVDARTEALPALAPGDALIVTGSPESVYQREPWMEALGAWLATEIRAGRPVLGLCFGHQLIAQALGGEVTQNPRGREMGTHLCDRLADDPLLDGLPARFSANQSHKDTVARAPEGAVVLARSERDAHQCLRFAPRCYGVQFHPEFDQRVMRGFIDARRPILAAEGLDADQLHEDARDTPDARRVLQNFVRLIR